MENERKLNFKQNAIQFVKKATATLLVAVTVMVSGAGMAKAETTKKYKQGTFIEEPIPYEETQYIRYVVKEGDNMSKISEKTCAYFGEEISARFWPAITYLNLNGKMRISIHPGDILYICGTYEDLVLLQDYLDESKWTSKYKTANDVYGTRKNEMLENGITLAALLDEIYGEYFTIDEDFKTMFLRKIGINPSRYSLSYVIKDTDTYFRLTEWLPTPKQLLGIEDTEEVEHGLSR